MRGIGPARQAFLEACVIAVRVTSGQQYSEAKYWALVSRESLPVNGSNKRKAGPWINSEAGQCFT